MPVTDLRQRMIVVVEDNEDIRTGLHDALAQQGYQVFATGDGHQALARLRRPPRVDALVLDLYMPGLSGFEIYQAVRSDPRITGIPIIVVTAASPNRRTGLQVAATIRKPVDLDELFFAVRAAVAASPAP